MKFKCRETEFDDYITVTRNNDLIGFYGEEGMEHWEGGSESTNTYLNKEDVLKLIEHLQTLVAEIH